MEALGLQSSQFCPIATTKSDCMFRVGKRQLSFINLFWQPVGIMILNIFYPAQIPGALSISPPKIWSFLATGKK